MRMVDKRIIHHDGSLLLHITIRRRENFVFATLDFANFPYATLDFDISLLPLLVFDNYLNCYSGGKSKIFGVEIVIHFKI